MWHSSARNICSHCVTTYINERLYSETRNLVRSRDLTLRRQTQKWQWHCSPCCEPLDSGIALSAVSPFPWVKVVRVRTWSVPRSRTHASMHPEHMHLWTQNTCTYGPRTHASMDPEHMLLWTENTCFYAPRTHASVHPEHMLLCTQNTCIYAPRTHASVYPEHMLLCTQNACIYAPRTYASMHPLPTPQHVLMAQCSSC
jgi:hypothetical protein